MEGLEYGLDGTSRLSQFLVEQLGQLEQQDGCILDGRRLAGVCSKRGLHRLALVPASTKMGDLVFHLPGCYVPFVFRRVENGTSQSGDLPRVFRVHLIGECLIDSIKYDDLDQLWQQQEDESILELECTGGLKVQ
jgi:hypothetical protein